MPKKSQFATEFILLITFMFIIFIGFTAITTNKILDAKENKRLRTAESIAMLAKNEINLAKASSDGYFRTFELPRKVDGNSYNITIIQNRELVVHYVDKEYVTFLPNNVVGDFNVNVNQIRKEKGIVYIN